MTVTDLNMTRFMMTMDDAIDLVLFAFKNGKNGEIFVKKSPAATIKTIINSLEKILNKKQKLKLLVQDTVRNFMKLYLLKKSLKKQKFIKIF